MLVFLAISKPPNTRKYQNKVHAYNNGFNRPPESCRQGKPEKLGGGSPGERTAMIVIQDSLGLNAKLKHDVQVRRTTPDCIFLCSIIAIQFLQQLFCLAPQRVVLRIDRLANFCGFDDQCARLFQTALRLCGTAQPEQAPGDVRMAGR